MKSFCSVTIVVENSVVRVTWARFPLGFCSFGCRGGSLSVTSRGLPWAGEFPPRVHGVNHQGYENHWMYAEAICLVSASRYRAACLGSVTCAPGKRIRGVADLSCFCLRHGHG